jgi:hypothetical protein
VRHLLHARNGKGDSLHLGSAAFEFGRFGRVVAIHIEIDVIAGDLGRGWDAAILVFRRELGHGDDAVAEGAEACGGEV